MKSFILGHSEQNLPIMGYDFGTTGPKVLILGGVHGDEIEGVIATKSLLSHFQSSFSLKLQLTIVPEFNVDGVLLRQRKNINQVDLNRNLPTNDWVSTWETEKYMPGSEACSESENKALCGWLETHSPSLIISMHSWKPCLNTNGDCAAEAEVLNKLTGYKVIESIGYPTPGCLGTYCGLEREMPTITYEIERGLIAKKIIDTHVPAILKALETTQERRPK